MCVTFNTALELFSILLGHCIASMINPFKHQIILLNLESCLHECSVSIIDSRKSPSEPASYLLFL